MCHTAFKTGWEFVFIHHKDLQSVFTYTCLHFFFFFLTKICYMCKIFVFRNKVSKKRVQMLPTSLVHSWANVFNLMAQIFHLEVPSGEFTLICAIVISKFSVLKSGIQVFQICMEFQIVFIFFSLHVHDCTGRRILHFHVHNQYACLHSVTAYIPVKYEMIGYFTHKPSEL